MARVRESRSARRPPSPLARSSGALLSDLLRLDLGGGCRPRSPGTRTAGTQRRGRRECAKAARGSAGGAGWGSVGSSPPPVLGKAAGPLRSCAGAGRRRVALGGLRHCPDRPGRGAAKLPPGPPSPFLVCRLRSLAGLGGRGCEMGTQALLSEPFRPRPGPGTQRAGPAMCWVCGVRPARSQADRRGGQGSRAGWEAARAASRGSLAPGRPAWPGPASPSGS